MASIEPLFKSGYIRGTDNGPPTNIRSKDAVLCQQYIQMGPGNKRIVCGKEMVMRRLYDIEIMGKVCCASLCKEVISPQSRYVFICDNRSVTTGHNNTKLNIICKECIEKNSMCNDLKTKKYLIIKNYYQ